MRRPLNKFFAQIIVTIFAAATLASANEVANTKENLDDRSVEFSMYERESVPTFDTLVARLSGDSAAVFARVAGTISTDDNHGNLFISGYRSFGVSLGSLGEINLEQGLEAYIEGEVAPQTILRAQFLDAGSSLDGSTREISDFDMMFIELTNPKFKVTAGDMFANWHEGGILSSQKKIVGIGATLMPKATEALQIGAVASFSGGNHTVQNIRGREGVQGPYYLTGENAGVITQPVRGSVKVRVNGRELAEGIENDFTVDYDMGAIIFNPSIIIGQDDFIRAEYEYKLFDYRRTFVGGNALYHTPDSVFSLRATLWSESDNKNSPIEMQLSEREINILKQSGNNPAYASSTARPVHHEDVARLSVFHPLYKMVYDENAGDTILVYTPYDPLRPEDTDGFFTVQFSPAQTGTHGADYVIDSSVTRGQFVYKYAGAMLGNFTALAPIAAPMRESAGEISMRLKLPNVNAELSVAGKEIDRNLFSTLDDGGDFGGAVVFKLSAGERSFDRRTIWADVDYRMRSQKFTSEIFSASDRRDAWGENIFADSVTTLGEEAWEATLGGTAVKGVELSAGGGQTYLGTQLGTEKITADMRLRFLDGRYGIDAGTAVFEHRLSGVNMVRRHGSFLMRQGELWEGTLDYKDEWAKDSLSRGTGHAVAGASSAYKPFNLHQRASFMLNKRGENVFNSTDTGYTITLEQSASFAFTDAWRFSGDNRYRRTVVYDSSATSTFLLTLINDIEQTTSGFSSRQEYRVNQEVASRFEQKMFFVGSGLGTHAFDSTFNEFRPSINGDHIIREVEIHDNTSLAAVRKHSLVGDWHFRPTRQISGMLNDISWSGILSIDEHVDLRNKKFLGYVPGALSLRSLNDNSNVSAVSQEHISPYSNYADMSYRQDIEHARHGSFYKTRLYALPSLRIVRGHKEPTFMTGLLIERKKESLMLSIEPRYFYISRESLPNAQIQPSFDLRDVGVEFIQSVGRRETFEFYLRERVGRIYDESENRVGQVPLDSSVYFQIRPGIKYRGARDSHAELSYTFSHVPWRGVLDHRMAGGNLRGTGHTIAFLCDLRAWRHFNFSAMYRGELLRQLDESQYSPMTHVFSMQLKALL